MSACFDSVSDNIGIVSLCKHGVLDLYVGLAFAGLVEVLLWLLSSFLFSFVVAWKFWSSEGMALIFGLKIYTKQITSINNW